jgi:N-acetylneuraminic acid mutarotase
MKQGKAADVYSVFPAHSWLRRDARPTILKDVLIYFLAIIPVVALSFPTKSTDVIRQLVLRRLVMSSTQHKALSFADRVAYQRAIEEVYWRHRAWPQERPDLKPPFDAVISQAELERKVQDYLRNSQALEDYWQQPITAAQLQAEMERMAKATQRPAMLRELFQVLGNDPFVIAECLARPALSERLVTNSYAHDERFHADLKRRAEIDLLAHATVEEMKRTSGTYTEIEIVKQDDSESEHYRNAQHEVKLRERDWNATLQKLASAFELSRQAPMHNDPDGLMRFKTTANNYQALPLRRLSPLQEDETRYYATALLDKANGRLKVATISWLKEPFESWRDRAESKTQGVNVVGASYTLPTIADDATTCSDTWAATSLNLPDAREDHTAVWTGREMIIWGGGFGDPFTPYNTGGRYNPSTGAWTSTTRVNAPSPRGDHSAVWTGSEMIIWGGGDCTVCTVGTGGRYNPATDTWTATSTVNAPSQRGSHTVVWTGTEMIIWGGRWGDTVNTGGRYNPTTNSWTPTSTMNAPTARYLHSAVWTGTQMIIWGGEEEFPHYVNTGGRYNPSTNSWTSITTTNAPIGRYRHRAVWTGSQMIVWGGSEYYDLNLNSGGKYNPTTNSWTATSTINAPAGRYGHSAVWTGSQMIIWGGQTAPGFVDTGARYNPGTNSWIATSTVNAAPSRVFHTAVWTGTEMIVWGGGGNDSSSGALSTGGRYNPATDTWATNLAPSAAAFRIYHTGIWTGSELIIWGGLNGYFRLNTGGRFDPSTDSWTETSIINAPAGRSYHSAIWTGTEMIVWGGAVSDSTNSGGRYNPTTNAWATTSTSNAPESRSEHTAVWTGTEMIIWGGSNGFNTLNTGGKYTPSTDTWTTTTITAAPSPRMDQTAVWTGNEMLIWGGSPDIPYHGNDIGLNTGGRYNPSTDAWIPMSTANAPDPRVYHTAVWTENEMIVWGGAAGCCSNFTNLFNTGGRYSPTTDIWTTTSIANAPSPCAAHTAVWTGSEMIVWGGASNYYGNNNTGGRYDPAQDSWTATSTTGNVPTGRYNHTAVWTGSEMIVWGGLSISSDFRGGGRYCSSAGPTPSPTPIATDFNRDGKPDFVLLQPSTGQTVIWYMNNASRIASAFGPRVPAGWNLIDMGDFNGDGNPDYVLFKPSTSQTAIWYMNNNVLVSGVYGPTLPNGWQLVALADFNNDGRPDYVLYNSSTRRTAIWYMNNNVYAGGVYGPTITGGWRLAGVADFNRDGNPDYLLFNPSTNSSVIWYLYGTAFASGVYGPTIASGYVLTGAADFDGDIKPDYLLFNPTTGRSEAWYLDNNQLIRGAYGPTLPAGWTLVRP